MCLCVFTLDCSPNLSVKNQSGRTEGARQVFGRESWESTQAPDTSDVVPVPPWERNVGVWAWTSH